MGGVNTETQKYTQYIHVHENTQAWVKPVSADVHFYKPSFNEQSPSFCCSSLDSVTTLLHPNVINEVFAKGISLQEAQISPQHILTGGSLML